MVTLFISEASSKQVESAESAIEKVGEIGLFIVRIASLRSNFFRDAGSAIVLRAMSGDSIPIIKPYLRIPASLKARTRATETSSGERIRPPTIAPSLILEIPNLVTIAIPRESTPATETTLTAVAPISTPIISAMVLSSCSIYYVSAMECYHYSSFLIIVTRKHGAQK